MYTSKQYEHLFVINLFVKKKTSLDIDMIEPTQIPCWTLTLREHVCMFPNLSLNRYTTGVIPALNVSPGSCDLDSRVTVPQLSVADGSV